MSLLFGLDQVVPGRRAPASVEVSPSEVTDALLHLQGEVGREMAQEQQLSIELSDNALRVLQRRYLIRDEDGTPLETPEDLFGRLIASTVRLRPK